MKKNKMMRIASVLLVAVLLSTCAISGTFAKYTSKYDGEATATVASWACKMNDAAIADAFTFDLGATVTETDGTEESEVDTTKKVIAPGTKGSFNIKLTNESDVTANYKITVTLDGQDAPPIEFTSDAFDGRIAYGEAKTVTVNWEWDWSETDETKFAGNSITATITIELVQVD